jgi:hypothetical protein
MRHASALMAALILLSLGSMPALAQKGHGGGPANKPQPSAHPTGKPASAPKPPTEHPAGPKTNGGNPHTAPATTTTSTAPAATSTTVTPTVTTTVTTTTPTSTTVKNPQLEQRLHAMLPAGMTVADASKGFKNWGQFVAAVHVSQNLNIPFVDLKARMTGITPGTLPGTTTLTAPMSLGQAIQSLKTTSTAPLTTSTVQRQVHRAESEADEDLRVAANAEHR